MTVACPCCGAELPAFTDAFCPECREELRVEEPAADATGREVEESAAATLDPADAPTVEPAAESPGVRRGRTIVNWVLVFCFFDALVWFLVLSVVAERGWEVTRNPLLVFVFLFVVAVGIHKGQGWARVLLTLKCGLTMIGSAALIAMLHIDRRTLFVEHFSILLPFAIVATVGFAVSTFALLQSASVAEFLGQHRPALSGEQLAVRCENCGKLLAFRAELKGSTQECPYCLGYVDVRG